VIALTTLLLVVAVVTAFGLCVVSGRSITDCIELDTQAFNDASGS
jgi:hypothetical protein